MREIKFRAWDKKGNKMLEVLDFQTIRFGNDSRPIMFGGKMLEGDMHNSDISKGQGGFFPINWVLEEMQKEFELSQYTGLKDKNGKEIYEGDIVTGHFGDEDDYDDPTPETKMTGEVFYDYDGFKLKVIEKLSDKDRTGMCNYFNFLEGTDFFKDEEVIGNIYKNPELLK